MLADNMLDKIPNPDLENLDLKNITLPHTCPNCKIVAHTLPELEKLFGYRNVPRGPNGERVVNKQSWCKKCRFREKIEAEE